MKVEQSPFGTIHEFETRAELLEWVNASLPVDMEPRARFWEHQFHSLCHGFLPCCCETCAPVHDERYREALAGERTQ